MTSFSGFRHLSAASALALGVCALPADAQNLSARTNPFNVTLQGIPSATVAPNGLAFASLSGTTRRAGAPSTDFDGSAAVGLGFGSAERAVGVQVTGNITSLTDDFGDSGYFDLKLSRRIKGGASPTYFSVTFGRIGAWGDARRRTVTESFVGDSECLECDEIIDTRIVDSNEITGTVALTQFSQLSLGRSATSYPVMFTLGAGTHIRNDQTDPGVFFGAGIGLSESLGVSAAWGGEYVNIGANLRLKQFKNASLSATVYDVFDTKDSRRLTMSVNFFTPNLFKKAAF